METGLKNFKNLTFRQLQKRVLLVNFRFITGESDSFTGFYPVPLNFTRINGPYSSVYG